MAADQSETLFRVVAAALFCTGLGISAHFRRKADRAGGRVSWEGEGVPMLVALRLSGLALWGAVVTYLVNPRWMQWSQIGLPAWARWAGAVLGVVTVALLYWLFSSLGKNITPTVATRAEHTLVTHGPYRWVRHPLYSVGTLFFLALSLLAANWFIAVASICALQLLALRIPREEAKLVERFGDAYRAYMARSVRLLPRFRGPR
jgi:protein-S-isoprenylcysteine O-methyltransferase Ste14